MANKIYSSLGGLSDEVTKMYCSVGGLSDNVVKGYCSVNGVAKQFYPSVNSMMNVSITTRIYGTHFVVDNVSIQTSIRNYP